MYFMCVSNIIRSEKVPTHKLQKELNNLISRKEGSNLLYRT